jgi:hypothetical protein
MEFLVLLAVLVCPIVMGGMMLWMMRQMRSGGAGADRTHEDDR